MKKYIAFFVCTLVMSISLMTVFADDFVITEGDISVTGSMTVEGNTAEGVTSVKPSAEEMLDVTVATFDKSKSSGKSPVIEIDLYSPYVSSELILTIPKSGVTNIAGNLTASLLVSSRIADFYFNPTAVQNLSRTITDDAILHAFKIDHADLSSSQREMLGDGLAYRFFMSSDGDVINNLSGGRVTVTIPYEMEGGNEDALFVYILSADGEIIEIPRRYNDQTEEISFDLYEFVTYMIKYDEFAVSEVSYSDVDQDDWYYTAVRYMNHHGYMQGVTEDRFAPNEVMTRAMFVTVLHRASGGRSVNFSMPFSDVEKNSWYEDAVRWAAAASIVNGTSAKTFDPNLSLSREQMATIIYTYNQRMGKVFPELHEDVTFLDGGSINDWATDAVETLQEAGIMTGREGNFFDPFAPTTRAEAAVVLMRYFEMDN